MKELRTKTEHVEPTPANALTTLIVIGRAAMTKAIFNVEKLDRRPDRPRAAQFRR